ncbi:MAG: hypothetical protein U5K84_14415 [Alkalibacterium sp.]|nr:hypothetical protein [Alkalibacterium sp.]
MLDSDSKGKEAIFRNIFQTNQFEAFQEKLTEQAKALRKERESYEQAVSMAFQTVAAEGNERLDRAIEQFDVKTALEEIEKLVEADTKQLTSVKTSIKQLQEQKTAYERLIERLEKKARLDKEKVGLDDKEPTIKSYQEQLAQNEEALKLVDAQKKVSELSEDIKSTREKADSAEKRIRKR